MTGGELSMGIEVGVDVGGTFTDAAVAANGEVVRAKAYSTKDVTGGILDALSRVRQQLELGEDEFFAAIEKFVLGNTIVTNVIDERRFPAVGLLTTAGFKDTLRIARSARGPSRDAHRHTAPPELVRRDRILEVTERVDVDGRVLREADRGAVRAAVEQLLGDGVQAIAVCLLWSFKNPVNEQIVADVVRELAPELPITLSSELAPVYREYERMVTTVLDAACKPVVARHFDELEAALRERGLRGGVKLMQVDGGFVSVAEAAKAPIKMFNSGPVGGVEGARRLGTALGEANVVTADMGGTSFDAAVITGGEYRVLPRAEMGAFPTALTAVDISSIGAGGGSIAWTDARGLMRIGPMSAGSVPGPACYGRGGEEPTVTDAAVAMGLIDPGYFLGGTITLDRDAALAAIRSRLCEPLGFSVDEAAAGIYRLTTVQMANAIRALTVNRGHDPREFAMVSFGGACGLFAAEIARECDVARVVVPAAASVFSAFGLLHADSLFTAVQTTPWTFAQAAEDLEAAYTGLQARVDEWFAADAIPAGSREVVREADMKFAGQVFEVTTRLPDEALTDALKQRVRDQFIADYETEFGSGTAWTEAEILVTNTRVRGIGRFGSNGGAPIRTVIEDTAGRTREIVEPITGLRREVEVHRGLPLGGACAGPCVIEEPDTSIYVPDGATITRDSQANYVIDLPGGQA
jgi:N-methylhydantoinase A